MISVDHACVKSRYDGLLCVDFLPEIWHTAVADFNCRPIEDFVEDVICRGFFVEDFEECTSNVGGYVSAEREVVPDDVRADCSERESV